VFSFAGPGGFASGSAAGGGPVPKDCERRPLEPTAAAESGPPLYQLTCDLRTINSEFDSTNFSVIPAAGTAALAIHCADALAAQSRLLNSSFAHLTLLQVCSFPK
jgi:hypothetical protein